jgi:hypothetical protein
MFQSLHTIPPVCAARSRDRWRSPSGLQGNFVLFGEVQEASALSPLHSELKELLSLSPVS